MRISPNTMKRAALLFLAVLLPLAGFVSSASAQQVTISRARVGNVAAGQFSVLWRVNGETVPGLDIYADAAASVPLNGELGVEFYPVEANEVHVRQTAADRAERRALQAAMKARNLVLARVTGARPGTTYYLRPRSFDASGAPNEAVPAPLLTVTAAEETAFVMESRQLRVAFPEEFSNLNGAVVQLTLEGAPWPLLAVVGDAGMPGKALFDLSRLLNAAGTTNAEPSGAARFTLELEGDSVPAGTHAADVAYAGEPVVARLSDTVFSVNLPGLASFTLEGPATALQGQPYVFNIVARDANGGVVASYNGGVTISGDKELFAGGGPTPAFVNGVLENYQIIPGEAGPLTLTASRGSGPETGSLTLNVEALSLAGWREFYFGDESGDESVAGPAADADGDGVPNALEYFFGTNPLTADARGLEEPSLTPDGDFVFHYWRARVAPGVNHQPVWSSNLSDWSGEGLTETVLDRVGALELVEVSVPAEDQTRVFGRIKLTLP